MRIINNTLYIENEITEITDKETIKKIIINNVYSIKDYAFKNFINLENVIINGYTSRIGESAFENCYKLKEVIYNNTNNIKIGNKCFRNCRNLKEIPKFVYKYPSYSFEKCTSLKEINIKEEAIIMSGAFKCCSNVRIINGEANIYGLDSYAFSGCSKLKSFKFYNLMNIPSECFSNCKDLKTVTLINGISEIDNRAFFNCLNLENINLPNSLISIGKEAFMNNNKLEEIKIGPFLNTIKEKAFTNMTALKRIIVSQENKRYKTTLDNKCLINIFRQSIVTYAIGNKDEDYTLTTYCRRKIDNVETTDPIYSLDPYSFAYSKNLNTLHLPACIKDIDIKAFEEAKIDNLVYEGISFFNSLFLNIEKNGLPYFSEIDKEKTSFPFKKLEFKNIEQITGNFDTFTNVEAIIANDIDGFYGGYLFNKLEKLDEITINKNTNLIAPNTFPNKTLVKFPLFETRGLISMQNTQGLNQQYKCYRLKNGYFLEDEGKLIRLDYKDVKCSSPESIKNDLPLYYDYEKDLKQRGKENITYLHNGKLMTMLDKDARKIFLDYISEDKTIERIITSSGLLNESPLSKSLLKKDKISRTVNNIEYLRNNNIKDRFLYNKVFLGLNEYYRNRLFKFFDSNKKRLIINSNIFEYESTSLNNLVDLIKLMEVLGSFSENKIIRQKSDTFINEKIIGKMKIKDDNIHRIFNELNIRDTLDIEFISFFMENYQELIENEKIKSGFITNIYNSFENIKKTSTSNKGNQRRLKVTIDFAIRYFANKRFNNVDKEYENLALFMSEYFTIQDAFDESKKILEESKKSPRNIFTKYKLDSNNKMIFDNSTLNDLKEKINDNYSFEWLSKKDYNNLILGKLCSCCAHIMGAGEGIMRASIILDNCQNMVIRNEEGTIIAKSTIYVNREKGYAVFNNVESSMNYKEEKQLEKIYNAFIRGAAAFIYEYNKNNDIKINKVTIGADRNTIIDYLTDENHPTTEILEGLHFKDYYTIGENGWDGDWKNKQRLIYKKL